MKQLILVLFFHLPLLLSAQLLPEVDEPVNETFQDVELKQVLTVLKNKYGIKTAFGERIVSEKRVTVQLINSTAYEAFAKILVDTDLDFEMVEPDVFIISKLKAQTTAITTVNLTGSVRDALSGESLPYAYLWSDEGNSSLVTNVDGYFSLTNTQLPTTLKISYLGYTDTTIVVTRQAANTRLKILLAPQPQHLREVVVTDEQTEDFERNDVAGKITINPAIASSVPSTGEVDIFRTLQLLPGINATNETSSGLSVRGGTTNQNLILFDGFTVYHVDHFFGYFSAFNSNAIKSVRVFKGGFGAEYGGRVSGIIDITGKDGNKHKTSGSLGVNLLSINTSLEVPLSENNTTLFFSGRRSYTDIITTPLFKNIFSNFSSSLSSNTNTASNTPPPNQQPTGHQMGGGRSINNQTVVTEESTIDPVFYYNDFNVKISSNISPRNRLSLSLYNSKDLLNFTEEATSNVNDTLTIESNTVGLINWGNMGSSLKLSRLWNNAHFSNMLISYSAYSSTYSDIANGVSTGENGTTNSSSSTDQDNGMKDFSIKLDHEWQTNASSALMLGLSTSLYTTNYINVTDTETVVDESQSNRTLTNAYVQYGFHPFTKLQMNLGVRGSYFSPTRKLYVVPRFSANLSITDRLNLKASYGQYNQFLNQTNTKNVLQGSRDFWLLADNDKIPVQHATHYLAGLDYRISHETIISVDAYSKTFDGLLEYAFSNGGLVTEFQNYEDLFFEGSGYAKGVEFLLKKNSQRYQTWIGYTLSEVVYTFADINGGRSYYADHDQRHEINAYGSYTLGKFKLFATWLYGSGQPYSLVSGAAFGSQDQQQFGSHVSVLSIEEKNARRLPTYHRLDVGATYFFGFNKLKGETTLSIFNVYDRTNIQDIKINRLAGGFQQGMQMQDPILQTTDVTLLGFSPNVSVKISF